MKLSEIYGNSSEIKISFEVFPPKDFNKNQELIQELSILKSYNPAFVSLTWGACGNKNESVELAGQIANRGFCVMPHFTCVANSKDFVKQHLKVLEEMGIENILALRGDIPEDKNLRCNDFSYANELVKYIRENSDLAIGVAGYPEGHIEAETLMQDILNLKKKVDAGADAIFTQLFFDNDKFLRYRDILHKQGIKLPVIPGIMPILSKKQIDKMMSLARITIPLKLRREIEKFQNSSTDMKKLGIDYGTMQCESLVKEGVFGLHFYTLNKSYSVKNILDNINI